MLLIFQRCQQEWHIRRQRGLKIHARAGGRMLKAQYRRVQGLAGQCLQRGLRGRIKMADPALHASPVKRVAQHGVADMCLMKTNLVRAAGLQMAGKARDLPVQKAFLHLIMGNGVARAFISPNSHFAAVVRRARKRRGGGEQQVASLGAHARARHAAQRARGAARLERIGVELLQDGPEQLIDQPRDRRPRRRLPR